MESKAPRAELAGKGRKVIIVGLGGAGLRFARACLLLDKAGTIECDVIAGVDISANRRKQFLKLGVPCFTSIGNVKAQDIDCAIITTPENNHVSSIKQIKARFPTVKKIICEKPIASTAREAASLHEVIADRDIVVNYVERFSPCIDELLRYIDNNNRNISRITAFWGKFRGSDPRPTDGVATAELCHPLDLALMLADVGPDSSYEIGSVSACASNFFAGAGAKVKLDTVHATIMLESGVEVVLSSSLLWSGRRRRVEVMLSDEHGTISELAILDFDDPAWDIDQLRITRISDGSSQLQPVLTKKVSRDDWPKELLTIGKVSKVVASTFAAMDDGEWREAPPLPGLRQAIYVQEVLSDIAEEAEKVAIASTGFRKQRDLPDRDFGEEIDYLANAIASGGAAEPADWDEMD